MLDTMRTGKDGDREQRTLYILITHTEKAGRSTAGDGLKITQMREIRLNSVIETISTPHYISYTISPPPHALVGREAPQNVEIWGIWGIPALAHPRPPGEMVLRCIFPQILSFWPLLPLFCPCFRLIFGLFWSCAGIAVFGLPFLSRMGQV